MRRIARSATPAILALLLQALPAFADEAGDPPVIDGCGLWPHIRCAGADLRHAKLAGAVAGLACKVVGGGGL